MGDFAVDAYIVDSEQHADQSCPDDKIHLHVGLPARTDNSGDKNEKTGTISPDVEITLVESPVLVHSEDSNEDIPEMEISNDFEVDSCIHIETFTSDSGSNKVSQNGSMSHTINSSSSGDKGLSELGAQETTGTIQSKATTGARTELGDTCTFKMEKNCLLEEEEEEETPSKRQKTSHCFIEDEKMDKEILPSEGTENYLLIDKDDNLNEKPSETDCVIMQVCQPAPTSSSTFIGPVKPQTWLSSTTKSREQSSCSSSSPAASSSETAVKASTFHLKSPIEYIDCDVEPCGQTFLKLSSQPPELLSAAYKEYETAENFLRGCKWSPDGTCIVSNGNDNMLRIYNTPNNVYDATAEKQSDFSAVVHMKECSMVYDYCWYPKMNSDDPDTCRLVSSSKDNSVHMWDAYTGKITCSYRAYNHLDEIVGPHSLAFSTNGDKLFCGFNNVIRVFDTARPGRDCVSRRTFIDKHMGQRGIISCIASSPVGNDLYAAGSFSKSIALYSGRKGDMLCMFEGQQGGVTHIAFSPDGNQLYSGGRMDPEIICWDLRKPGHILYVALRKVLTHQRMYFDLDKSGRYLISGSHDGLVYVWDTSVSPVNQFEGSDAILPQLYQFTAHADSVNGISIHPDLPYIATASGQRHYSSDTMKTQLDEQDSEDENRDEDIEEITENSLKIWKLN